MGPGVRQLGTNAAIWSDHANIRPTMLALLRLRDDYPHQGRVLFEALDPTALDASARASLGPLTRLGQVYQQINAPLGDLGLKTLAISTRAIASGDNQNDRQYASREAELTAIAASRDALAAQMSTILEGAVFANLPVDPAQIQSLLDQGNALLARVNALTSQ